MAVSVYTGAGGGVASFNGRTGKVVPANGDYTKAQVGLGNVDNTSDANKPISNATQAALNAKQSKITANGILKGDGTGTITAASSADFPKEVFWATFGTTTHAEIREALTNDKIVKVYYQYLIYDLVSDSGNQFHFINISKSIGALSYIMEGEDSWWEPEPINGNILDQTFPLPLPAASWTGSDPYTQTIPHVLFTGDPYLKVDIQPSEEVYDQLVADNVGYLAIKNVNGTFTAVAKGGKPSVDLTVQVTYNDVS